MKRRSDEERDYVPELDDSIQSKEKKAKLKDKDTGSDSSSKNTLTESLVLFQRTALPKNTGEILFASSLFNSQEAQIYFNTLLTQIQWSQKSIHLFGKLVNQPRLIAFYGDVGIKYTYSSLTLESYDNDGWGPLTAIKSQLEKMLNMKFNACLCNLYRNGNDYMGFHSDDEKELGKEPTIVSISFGAERRFVFKSKCGTMDGFEYSLGSGSCLIMQGQCQKYWKHALPKMKKVTTERINLTFRSIVNT